MTVALLEFDKQRVRFAITDVLADVGLGINPPRLVTDLLNFDDAAADGEPTLERR